ncbi:hypothetical protein ACJX0J_015818, partial [Zea mays]
MSCFELVYFSLNGQQVLGWEELAIYTLLQASLLSLITSDLIARKADFDGPGAFACLGKIIQIQYLFLHLSPTIMLHDVPMLGCLMQWGDDPGTLCQIDGNLSNHIITIHYFSLLRYLVTEDVSLYSICALLLEINFRFQRMSNRVNDRL